MATMIQRPLRGSRISTFYPVKSLPSLSSLDSAFQLQEYISLLIRLDVHDVEAITSLPGNSASEKEKEKDVSDQNEQDKTESKEPGSGVDKDSSDKGKNDVAVDEACWIYEQIRRLAQDLSHPLITTLQQECTRASCPEMKAGEWLYLCVAHGNEGAMEHCCAIDYILHTVDSATALLNSPRTFPSRMQIPPTSHRHFSSLARRLGRIFAHAYFHHREAFEQAEAESSLYARFLALTSKFDLVPTEFLVIPPNNQQEEPHHGRNERFGLGYSPFQQQPHNLHPMQNKNDDHEYSRNIAPLRMGTAGQGKHAQHPLSQGPQPPILSREFFSPESTGGIGESPSAPPSESRSSKFGRNRTDTMILNGAEANLFVEQLRSPSGAVPVDDPAIEAEAEQPPKTTQPTTEAGHGEEPEPLLAEKGEEEATETEFEPEEQEERDVSEGAHFEISLSPDEEIGDEFEQLDAGPVEEEPAVPESGNVNPSSEGVEDHDEASEVEESEIVDEEPPSLPEEPKEEAVEEPTEPIPEVAEEEVPSIPETTTDVPVSTSTPASDADAASTTDVPSKTTQKVDEASPEVEAASIPLPPSTSDELAVIPEPPSSSEDEPPVSEVEPSIPAPSSTSESEPAKEGEKEKADETPSDPDVEKEELPAAS